MVRGALNWINIFDFVAVKWYALVIVFFLFGCDHPNRRSNVIATDSTIRKSSSAIFKKHHGKKKISLYDDTVSANLAIMLHDALNYTLRHKNHKHFKKRLKIWHFNYDAEVDLEFGNLFSSRKQNLIVRSKLWDETVALDLFSLKDTVLKLIYHDDFEMSFTGYAIKDVNGDGIKDFVISFYPSSGCCIRDVNHVCLQTDIGFTAPIELMNPTFSPSEKIVRGVGYGHAGFVELYKFKWNGLKLDTIEMIFPDTLNHRYHVFKRLKDAENPMIGKFISDVPKEYHHIGGYEWFLGE